MIDNHYVVDAFIEIPKYSSNKYEFDEESGQFRLDRTLYSPVHYPTDYGFIPETLAEDGDAVDIMVMLSVPTFPGCRVRARVIGALEMEDEKGHDTKILAVSVSDPRYKDVLTLDGVPPHVLKEVEYFFGIYKDLEEKETHVLGWEGRTHAIKVVEAGFAAHQNK